MVRKVVTRRCYLGVFVGNRGAKDRWLAEKVQGWEELSETLSGFARKHLQFAYVRLQKSLQQEREFVQQVTPNIGDAFGSAEQAPWDAFILSLFQGL